MSTVNSLKQLYKALINDEKEIIIKQPALNEYRRLIIFENDTNLMKSDFDEEILKEGASEYFYDLLHNVGTGALPPEVEPDTSDIALEGLFLVGFVASTVKERVQSAKLEKENKKQKEIMKTKYPNIDLEKIIKLRKKWYCLSSMGNSFISIKHK